jgi:hypothetical protein
MRVIVAGQVVEACVGTTEARKLHQLLNHACDGRHVVLFDPPGSIEGWLTATDDGTRGAYLTALGLSARRATALSATACTVRVDLTPECVWGDPVAVLPLDEALALLAEPLGILVENSVNDWHFLTGIMRVSERQIVDRALQQGWAQVLHGGGATIVAQIEARLTQPRLGFQTFVVFDSDRRHPTELHPRWQPTGQETCAGFLVETLTRAHLSSRYWMLRRRYIESYMPRKELAEAVSANVHPDAVEAFFRLREEARWFFNVKSGFRGDEPAENRHRCRDLYDDVAAEDREALYRGFGRIAEQYVKATSREFDWDADARRESANSLPNLLRLF